MLLFQGYLYAGVQFGSQCFCGNEYDKYGEASNCNMECRGDKKQLCGGVWANQVYQAGKRAMILVFWGFYTVQYYIFCAGIFVEVFHLSGC